MAQFSVNSYSVEQIINWIRSKEIAIPEIQRPFVWDGKKVRDLIDSLYKGFPIGYIVTWKNPNIKLKDGTISQGKKNIDRWSATSNSITNCYSNGRGFK